VSPDFAGCHVPTGFQNGSAARFLNQRRGPARTHIAVGIGHKLSSWVREKMRDARLRIGSVRQTIMTEQSNYRNSHLGKVALVLLAVALVAILGVYESIPVKQHNAAVASAAPDPTAQAIRDLQTSQQQAIQGRKAHDDDNGSSPHRIIQPESADAVQVRRLPSNYRGRQLTFVASISL
jgi:hypothetical protein